MRRRSFRCLCLRIFFRRFLTTLDMNGLQVWQQSTYFGPQKQAGTVPCSFERAGRRKLAVL